MSQHQKPRSNPQQQVDPDGAPVAHGSQDKGGRSRQNPASSDKSRSVRNDVPSNKRSRAEDGDDNGDLGG